VARAGVAVVLMHNRGRSVDMYERAQYADIIAEVASELTLRDQAARDAGIAADRIILDPGVGFAKRASHSFAVIAALPRLVSLGRPLLSGPSRKSFLTKAVGDRLPAGRVWATAAAVTASILRGAHIVRVHDVKPMVDVVRVADEIAACQSGQPAEGKEHQDG
jgi:dihydropteroate synthase